MSSNCTLCILHKEAKTNCMRGVGSEHADLMFVGESPGEVEDEEGIPFVGRAGKLLRKIVKAVGLNADQVFITNLNRCRPPENRTPTKSERRACRPYLDEEIERIKPKLILLLGNSPMRGYLDLPETAKIQRERGQISKGPHGIPVMPLLHPSFLLRNPYKIKLFVEDLKKAIAYVSGSREAADTTRPILHYGLCKTLDDVRRLAAFLLERKLFAFDLETHPGLSPFVKDAKILMMQFCWSPGRAVAVPVAHRQSPLREDVQEVFSILKPVVASSVPKAGHRGKFDMLWSAKFGMPVSSYVYDTEYGEFLLDETDLQIGLKDLAHKHTPLGGYETALTDYVREHKEADPRRGGTYDNIPLIMLKDYGCGDVDCTLRSMLKQRSMVIAEGQMPVMEKLLLPLTRVFVQIELDGVQVDRKYLEEISFRYAQRKAEVATQLSEMPCTRKYMDSLNEYLQRQDSAKKFKPQVFSPTKDQLVAGVLFKQLKLPIIEATKSGKRPSVSRKNVLDVLAGKHPFVDLLIEYKELNSMDVKFIKPLPKFLDEKDRVHTWYNLIGTVTGRGSSARPNMQQIPRATKGNEFVRWWNIKRLFVSRFGKQGCILSADYAHMELRIMALYSRDKVLLATFRSDEDPHLQAASDVFGKSQKLVTAEERTFAKTAVSFGLIYGRRKEALAKDFRKSVEWAGRFIERYFRVYTGVRDFIIAQHAKALRDGFVTTLTGRKRRLPEVNAKEEWIRAEALRKAVNAPIQGTASDILSDSIVRIADRLSAAKCKSKLILDVHDSVVLDVYRPELLRVAEIVVYEMEHVPFDWLDVPLKAELEVSPVSWGTVEKVTLDALPSVFSSWS